jgi:CheY-like chemotaxis protein/signal recognition particle receptor subunit beta
MDAPNILVIDGDPKNLQILKESLESSGFRVTTCSNGNEAWGLIQSRRHDIIVTEVDIPGLNGFELLDKIQKDPAAASVPLVFLTNRRNLEDRLKSLRSGVKDYMIKPLHVKEVIARLHMILRRLERVRHEESESNKKIVGRLEEKSVEALVEEYGRQRKTGVLTLYDHNNRSGEIYFRDGAVVKARFGNFKAEKAVYQMLPWQRGHYVMDLKEINVEDEITVSNLGLLVQGVKQIETREKLLKLLPDLETVFERTAIFEEILKRKTIAADALRFIALFDGQRSLSDILAESTYDDIKTLEKIVQLHQQGFIKPLNGEPQPHLQRPSDSTITLPEIAAKKFQTPNLRGSVANEIKIDQKQQSQAPGANGMNENKFQREIPAPFASLEANAPKPQPTEFKTEPKPVAAVTDGGQKKETPPKISTNQFGANFDQLFNGQVGAVGRFVVLSSDSESRKKLIALLSQNNFLSKNLDRNGAFAFELAKIVTPNRRVIEILGVSTERKFLQMLEPLSDTLLGYLILIGDQNLSNLGYAAYLINSLKRQFAIPHVIVLVQSHHKRTIPLEVVRYSLKLAEDEQLVEIDVRDAESVKHLLQQLRLPLPHSESNGQTAAGAAAQPQTAFR